MTCLPLIRREMRALAQSGAAYWMRFGLVRIACCELFKELGRQPPKGLDLLGLADLSKLRLALASAMAPPKRGAA